MGIKVDSIDLYDVLTAYLKFAKAIKYKQDIEIDRSGDVLDNLYIKEMLNAKEDIISSGEILHETINKLLNNAG